MVPQFQRSYRIAWRLPWNGARALSEEEGSLNTNQRRLVISTIVLIGFLLSYLMLEWGDGWGRSIAVVILSKEPISPGSRVMNYWGIYTIRCNRHIVGNHCTHMSICGGSLYGPQEAASIKLRHYHFVTHNFLLS